MVWIHTLWILHTCGMTRLNTILPVHVYIPLLVNILCVLALWIIVPKENMPSMLEAMALNTPILCCHFFMQLDTKECKAQMYDGYMLPSHENLPCKSQFLVLEFDAHISQCGRLTAKLFDTKQPTTRIHTYFKESSLCLAQSRNLTHMEGGKNNHDL